jgi:hypothetical protein
VSIQTFENKESHSLAINISPLRGWLAALTIGGVSETSSNIIFGELWIVAENLFISHSDRQPTEHVCNGDAYTANVGRPPRLTGSIVMMPW